MNAYTAVAIVNSLIIVAIIAISLAGFIVAQSGAGLWSVLLAFFMMSTSKSGDKAD